MTFAWLAPVFSPGGRKVFPFLGMIKWCGSGGDRARFIKILVLLFLVIRIWKGNVTNDTYIFSNFSALLFFFQYFIRRKNNTRKLKGKHDKRMTNSFYPGCHSLSFRWTCKNPEHERNSISSGILIFMVVMLVSVWHSFDRYPISLNGELVFTVSSFKQKRPRP